LVHEKIFLRFKARDEEEEVKTSFIHLDDSTTPWRLYVCDRESKPGFYATIPCDGNGEVELIVLNFPQILRKAELLDLSFADALVLTELHELTHWALSEEEDQKWREKSHALYWYIFLKRNVLQYVKSES